MSDVNLAPFFPVIPASEVIVPQGNVVLPYTAILPSGVPATIQYSNYKKSRQRRLYKSVVKVKNAANAVASTSVPGFTSVTPDTDVDSAEALSIVGSNFDAALSIAFISANGTETVCGSIVRSSATAASCVAPAVVDGVYGLKLSNPAGFRIIPAAVTVTNV